MERNWDRYHARPLILLLAVLIASMVTLFVLHRTEAKAQSEVQMAIAGEVLRFHILANSDSEEDQALKLKVRDKVLTFMEKNMPQSLSAEETKTWVREHLAELEEIGRGEVAAQGRTDTVSAAVTTCYFPEKSYGELTFPAGNYEALRVEIGAAMGHNWWCVLYPGICFEDAVNVVIDGEAQKLSHVLTEEEYSQVTAESDFEIHSYFSDKWNNK